MSRIENITQETLRPIVSKILTDPTVIPTTWEIISIHGTQIFSPFSSASHILLTLYSQAQMIRASNTKFGRG